MRQLLRRPRRSAFRIGDQPRPWQRPGFGIGAPATPFRLVRPDETLVYGQRVLVFLEAPLATQDRIVAALGTWAVGVDDVLEVHGVAQRDATHRLILVSVDMPLLQAADLVTRVRLAAGGVPFRVRYDTPDVGEIVELSLEEAVASAMPLVWPAGALLPRIPRPSSTPWGWIAGGALTLVLVGVVVSRR